MLFESCFFLGLILASIGASVSGGIVGSYVVAKRIASVSGSVAHSVFGGLGFALWLQRSKNISWMSPFYGAFAAAILSALAIGWMHKRYKEREDTVIGIIWTLGTAIGVIFLAFTPGYNVEIMNFLAGNILWVRESELIFLLSLDVIISIICLLYHKFFVAVCFDEKQLTLQGYNANNIYYLLLILVALSTVVMIQVMGVGLMLSIFTLPSAIAGKFSHRLSTIMILSILINFALFMCGLFIAYKFNLPTGASISILAGLAYLLSLLIKKSCRS